MYLFNDKKDKVGIKIVETPIGSATAGASINWTLTAADLADQGVDDISKYMILAVNDVIPALEGDEAANFFPPVRDVGDNYCYPTVSVSIDYTESQMVVFWENSSSESSVRKIRIALLEIR